jgi:hypothetical protein
MANLNLSSNCEKYLYLVLTFLEYVVKKKKNMFRIWLSLLEETYREKICSRVRQFFSKHRMRQLKFLF